jgi:hypothetical protein
VAESSGRPLPPLGLPIAHVTKEVNGRCRSNTKPKRRDRVGGHRSVPGLLQKYYVRYPESGQFGGVYVWESREAMQRWRDGQLAGTIAETYQVTDGPTSEDAEVMLVLHGERDPLQVAATTRCAVGGRRPPTRRRGRETASARGPADIDTSGHQAESPETGCQLVNRLTHAGRRTSWRDEEPGLPAVDHGDRPLPVEPWSVPRRRLVSD